MAFNAFDMLEGSESEARIAKQASVDKMSAAIYDVREKVGPVLFASRDIQEFRHKVAMMKNDQTIQKIVAVHLPPVSGVMRRIVGKAGVMEKEFRTLLATGLHESPSLDRPETQGEPRHRAPGFLDAHPVIEKGWDALTAEPKGHSFANRRTALGEETGTYQNAHPDEWYASKGLVNPNKMWNNFHELDVHHTGAFEGDLKPEGHFEPSELKPKDDWKGYLDSVKGSGAKKVQDRNFTSSMDFQIYADWAEANRLHPMSLNTLDRYASNLSDVAYLKLARAIQAWDFEHKPSTPKGQSKKKLKDVTAYSRQAAPGDLPEANGSMGPELGGTNGLSEHDNAGLSRIEQGHPGMSAWADNAPEKEMPITGKRRRATTPGTGNDQGVDPTFGTPTGEAGMGFGDPFGPAGSYTPPTNSFQHAGSQDPMRKYIAWCKKNGYKRLSARNIDIYSQGNPRLAAHLAQRSLNAIHVARQRMASEHELRLYDNNPDANIGQRMDRVDPYTGESGVRPQYRHEHNSESFWDDPHEVGRHRAEAGRRYAEDDDESDPDDGFGGKKAPPFGKKDSRRRRQAAPDYLNKAQDALTQLLNQKAEEFQETIAPLQQALVTVQQATQLQQSQNPMNVLPPPGTVNVMPGGDQGPVGMPAPGAQDLGAAAQALAGPLGGGGAAPPPGGDPSGGGGAPPPGGGGAGAPPPAAAGGGLPPELSGQAQQATARKRGGQGKGRGANKPRQAGVADLWNKWTQNNTGIGGDADYEQFAQQFGVGPRALHKLKQQHGVVDMNAPAVGIAAKRHAEVEQKNHVEEAVKAQWEKQNSHMGVLGYKWDKGLNLWTKPGQRSVKNFWQHTGAAGYAWNPTPTGGFRTPEGQFPAGMIEPGRKGWPSEGGYIGHMLTGEQWHDSDPTNAEVGVFGSPEEAQAAVAQAMDHHKANHPEKFASRKEAWMGWGPAVAPRTRQVHGWNWDNYLNGYKADTPRTFECACGEPFPAPTGFHRCACGKQWNSYVIGTGGNRHEAAAEQFLVREIPTRDNVIVASRQMEADYKAEPVHLVDKSGKIHTLIDPGEVDPDGGEDPGHSTFKQPPSDWAKRGPGAKWQKSPIGR